METVYFRFFDGFLRFTPILTERVFLQGEVMAIEGNVVVVTINYRLGTLGFGYLGIDGMPGNMGLLDQQMALRWIVANIAGFGGDPERVTLFGQSAGGGSVAGHMASSGSRDLFSTAILQSGNLLSTWNFLDKVIRRCSYAFYY